MGNTCIIKPPSIDSLEALKFAELLDTLDLPPGTINLITGPGGPVGGALSITAAWTWWLLPAAAKPARKSWHASQTVKRLQLELGGKNPVIILDDADIDKAAAQTMTAQYKNCGQICASPGRIYVHEKVYDEFLEKFIVGAKKVITGNPADPKTVMGPVGQRRTPQQYRRLH